MITMITMYYYVLLCITSATIIANMIIVTISCRFGAAVLQGRSPQGEANNNNNITIIIKKKSLLYIYIYIYIYICIHNKNDNDNNNNNNIYIYTIYDIIQAPDTACTGRGEQTEHSRETTQEIYIYIYMDK